MRSDFVVLLTQAVEEDSLAVLAKGGIPRLAAWRLHNGTVWRWNPHMFRRGLTGKPGFGSKRGSFRPDLR
jgi:hypothetical protein